MIKIIGIGFLGLGTVGSKVLTLIKENQAFVEEKSNIKFVIRSVFVRDIYKDRGVDLSGIYVTSNYEEVINNPDIQVCFECMGGAGTDKTLEVIKGAIKNGKHVIMSSKKCLALYSNQILQASNYYNVQLRFEATVGGAIPICRTLMSMSKNNKINKMYGIVNATTNYIISLMEESEMDFNLALNSAKEKGFAENDSSEDIDGWDAAYKMSILLRVGMNLEIACEKLNPVSIRSMSDWKISENHNIRQIFYLERQEDNSISYYIGPMELEKNHILCNVKENFNMICIESRYSGLRAFYGKGAGGKETASVMYEDLLDLNERCYWFETADNVECRNIDINERMLAE